MQVLSGGQLQQFKLYIKGLYFQSAKRYKSALYWYSFSLCYTSKSVNRWKKQALEGIEQILREQKTLERKRLVKQSSPKKSKTSVAKKIYDSKQIAFNVLEKHKSQPLKEIELKEIKPEILSLSSPKEQRLDTFATIDDGGIEER